MKQIEEIKEIVNKRTKEYGIERIYLFGSYARGDANEASDIDLCIDRKKYQKWVCYGGIVAGFRSGLGHFCRFGYNRTL